MHKSAALFIQPCTKSDTIKLFRLIKREAMKKAMFKRQALFPSIAWLATYSAKSDDVSFQKVWRENFERPLLDNFIQ